MATRTPPKNPSAMPPPPNFDVHRVLVIGELENQVTLNTFCYITNKAVGTSKTADLLNTATLWMSPVGPFDPYLACLSLEWIGTRIEVDCPTTPNLAPFQTELVAKGGTGPAGHEPTTVCVTMHNLTEFRGKHGRGRALLPAVPTTWVTASSLNAAGQYAMLAQFLQTAMADGQTSLTPGVLSFDWWGGTSDWGWVNTKKWTYNTVLGTCRRRKLGRGI